MKKSVWIIAVNWKNAADTCECLESIIECFYNGEISGVVVCDNNSGDGSVDAVAAYALSRNCDFHEFAWSEGRFTQVVARGSAQEVANGLPVYLLHTGANLGFAGGNNIGIRFLQQHKEFDYLMLLNNDAMLTSGAVSEMVKRYGERSDIGMCGCTVIYHHTPSQIQALGGARYNRWFGRSQHLGGGSSVTAPRSAAVVEPQLDYVLGAALMISRECLEAIGLMEESYFLYYEELDWAIRARRAGYELGYSAAAEVLHKEGKTIGSSSKNTNRSLLSEYYLFRNRQKLTRRFYPEMMITVFLFSLAQALRPLLRFDFRRSQTRLRGLFGVAM